MKHKPRNSTGPVKKDTSLRYLTWGQIKKEVEAQGVKDGDGVQFIDILGLNDPVLCKAIPVFLRERPTWEIFQ